MDIHAENLAHEKLEAAPALTSLRPVNKSPVCHASHTAGCKLTPYNNRECGAFFEQWFSCIKPLVVSLGSPLHLVFPQQFASNVGSYRSTYRKHGVDGRLYYACKANKSRTFLTAAAMENIGVDVSSVNELSAAMSCGAPGHTICITGPVKTRELLFSGTQHGATIHLDGGDDIQSLKDMIDAGASPGEVRVVLRYRPESQSKSRFGFTHDGIEAAFNRLSQPAFQSVTVTGLSVHHNGYSARERASSLRALLALALKARSWGVTIKTISIGGGLPVRYLDSEREWRRFQQGDKARFHQDRQFGGFYPCFPEHIGEQCLEAILSHTAGLEKTSNAELLRKHDIRLDLELGRALLANCGVSLFSVVGCEGKFDDYGVVTVDGTSFSLSEQWFDSEYLPDPYLLANARFGSVKTEAIVAGNTCLERDVLSWRRLAFPFAPERGDLLAYTNTAGYQMDSNESTFHQRPLPKKVAVAIDGDGFHWCDDDNATAWMTERLGVGRGSFNEKQSGWPNVG